MSKMIRVLLVILLASLAAGCLKPQGASTYSRQQMGRAASVIEGTIISIRAVDISGTSSGVGSGAGAAAGAVGGSYAGGDARTAVLGAIGGAVVGGIAGAVAESEATRTKASEFLISLENGDKIAIVQVNEQNLKVGDDILLLKSDRVRIVRDPTKNGS